MAHLIGANNQHLGENSLFWPHALQAYVAVVSLNQGYANIDEIRIHRVRTFQGGGVGYAIYYEELGWTRRLIQVIFTKYSANQYELSPLSGIPYS